MQQRGRFFEDAARLAEGALGTVAGVRREIETVVRQQMERLLERMELVTREEFEAVKELAATARAEQEDLAERVARLEAALQERPAQKPARPASTSPPPGEE